MQSDILENARLVIISNRLPVVIKCEKGKVQAMPGAGGLVSALAPVLKNRGGVWMGWIGDAIEQSDEVRRVLHEENQAIGFTLFPIFLTQEEIELYYHGFSNDVIWPLFHDLQFQCHFEPAYWQGYQEINRKFAEAVKSKAKKKDFIWVHDYQLLLLGQQLRALSIFNRLSFFLHIPFPPLDIFLKLPWREQILKAMLQYDFIGFQTVRDLRNFIQCVKMLCPKISIKSRGMLRSFKTEAREVQAGAFPISIDYREISSVAAGQEVAEKAVSIHEKLGDQKIVFSLDRLDYSKGIPYRLKAIRYLLKHYPELHEKVTFIQVVVPSRVDVQEYRNLKVEIDKTVSEINSEFTKNAWVPIHYLFRTLNNVELLSYYRTSEVVLVTSIKDGMNLVVKEYIAANVDENGVVILSEFAGAAVQLHEEALLVNPYDVAGVAEAINRALKLPALERKQRMHKMRRQLRKYDIFWWLESFLTSALSKELHDFPVLTGYKY